MQAVARFDAELSAELNDLMNELHALVSRLQKPRTNSKTWTQKMQDECVLLKGRIEQLLEQIQVLMEQLEEAVSDKWQDWRDDLSRSWADHKETLSKALVTVSEQLSSYSAELAERPSARRAKSMFQALADGYEELVTEIRELKQVGLLQTARARHLKPINYARNIFHACMGIGSVSLYAFVLTRGQCITILSVLMTIIAGLEISRRFFPKFNDYMVDKLFGMIARPHERYQVNGTSYYTAALLLIVLLYPKTVVMAAVMVLALADPAASVAGKLFGRKKIIGEKSYIGSLTFLVVAYLTILPFALSMHSLAYAMIASLIVALSGTLAELYVKWVDDNFSIPVVCATVGFLVM